MFCTSTCHNSIVPGVFFLSCRRNTCRLLCYCIIMTLSNVHFTKFAVVWSGVCVLRSFCPPFFLNAIAGIRRSLDIFYVSVLKCATCRSPWGRWVAREKWRIVRSGRSVGKKWGVVRWRTSSLVHYSLLSAHARRGKAIPSCLCMCRQKVFKSLQSG